MTKEFERMSYGGIDGMEIRLSLSGETPPQAIASRFAAVGMIRGEYLLRPHEEYVTLRACQDRLAAYCDEIARLFDPKPVWYRTTELTSDEANTLAGVDLRLREADPMKGLRGLRRGIELPDAFVAEVQAVARAARGSSNLHLLLPYVGSAHEFEQGLRLVEKAGWPNRIGSMMEIPAAVMEADRFVALGASNLMVGMNDLTSLVTGAARGGGFENKLNDCVWWMIDRLRHSAHGHCEWGIAGNLTQPILARAEAESIPYSSVHYCDLPILFNVDRASLPGVELVGLTKIRTRSQIAAAELRRTLVSFDLPVPW